MENESKENIQSVIIQLFDNIPQDQVDELTTQSLNSISAIAKEADNDFMRMMSIAKVISETFENSIKSSLDV
jgi:hypothetical protein